MAEIRSTSIWDSRTVQRLDLFGAIVAIFVLARLVWEEDIGWIAGATAGLLVILLTVIKWPYGVFVILFAMSAGSGIQFELFGLNAHPEHIAIGLISVAFVIAILLHTAELKLTGWTTGFLDT